MSGSVDNRKELRSVQEKYPDMFILGPETTSKQVEAYLVTQKWPGATGEVTKITPAGEVFNMNCTVRVAFTTGSVVLKQSRPFVERYPTVQAPIERVNAEALFYSLVGKAGLDTMTPKLLGHDTSSYIICMEDLGKASDYGTLYTGDKIPVPAAESLGKWLAQLHKATFNECDRKQLVNDGMLQLTSDYVFTLPMKDEGGGVDLDKITPGLSHHAEELRRDATFSAEVETLCRKYLNPESTTSLLHGDFFPASWMTCPSGPRVIDCEFAHFGTSEFDLGVALGHLILTDNRPAAAAFLQAYTVTRSCDVPLAMQFAGVEIMRRTIGLAQLPLEGPLATLDHKTTMLSCARQLVCQPSSWTM